MRFKFKPQKALVVGGLLAATYASACWYQGSAALCFTSGSTVDQITFLSVGDSSGNPWQNQTTHFVIATADWHYNAINPPQSLVYKGPSGQNGYSAYTQVGTYNTYGPLTVCSGAAKFQDAAGQWTTVSQWRNGSAGGLGSYGIPTSTVQIYDSATTSGNTTCS